MAEPSLTHDELDALAKEIVDRVREANQRWRQQNPDSEIWVTEADYAEAQGKVRRALELAAE